MAQLDATNLCSVIGVASYHALVLVPPGNQKSILPISDLRGIIGVASYHALVLVPPGNQKSILPISDLRGIIGVASYHALVLVPPGNQKSILPISDLRSIIGPQYELLDIAVGITAPTLTSNISACSTCQSTITLTRAPWGLSSSISNLLVSPKKIKGYVTDGSNGGVALSRRIVAFPRNDPTSIHSVISSPFTGSYEFLINDFPPGYFCVVALDDNEWSNALVCDWIYLS